MLFLRAVTAFLALPGMVAFAIPIWVGVTNRFPMRDLPGAVVAVGAGTLLLLWCVREFYVTGRGTLAPWSPPIRLVTTGPYRFSRNPMYVGVVTILIGWSILWHSRSLTTYTVCFAGGFYLRVLLVEEPWARRTFGSEWEAYRSRVPRWFI